MLGLSDHTGTAIGSTTMLAGGKDVVRRVDKGECQSLILGSGSTVMVGG